jgi:hypothetical protein
MAVPVMVEPVNATLSISIRLAITAPAFLPKPEIKLTVPAGNPASLISSHFFRLESGATSADLMTIAFPVANAGAIF